MHIIIHTTVNSTRELTTDMGGGGHGTADPGPS